MYFIHVFSCNSALLKQNIWQISIILVFHIWKGTILLTFTTDNTFVETKILV